MKHPFADLIDLRIQERSAGQSTVSLVVGEHHLNPHNVVHGAVLYALADTGMGAALYPTLDPGEICVTIEIKINYFKPVTAGEVICKSVTINRGRSVANLESRVFVGSALVASANGNFAILRPKASEKQ